MRFERVLIEFRESLSQLSHEVEMSVKSGHTNIAHISESLFRRLLNTLYGWHLKDLNTGQPNFPAIDLADEDAGIAIQVTATPSIGKIKDTIGTFLDHKLQDRYHRLIILVITKRQDSYHQKVIDDVVKSRMAFDVSKDIIDYRTLSAHASRAKPHRVQLALSHLTTYLRGAGQDLAKEDFNPPVSPKESLTTNLVPIRFPQTLYVADLVVEGRDVNRQTVRRWLLERGVRPPSDYEVRSHQILSFRDLSQASPFSQAIDPGTVTPLHPTEYYEADLDQESTFKSLLRLLLQQNLYHEDVRWNHEGGLFIFCPRADDPDTRVEQWHGRRLASKTVFIRKMKRDEPTEVLSTRHLAFSVNFLLLKERWYAALMPDWFFSSGEDFVRSRFADKQLSGLKKIEKEPNIRNAFRFIAWWLASRPRGDLLSPIVDVQRLEFGDTITVAGGRPLDEDLWKPLDNEELDHGLSLF